MVAWEQVEDNIARFSHGAQRSLQHTPAHLVGLEHVPADHHKRAALLDGQRPHSRYGLNPCVVEPRLSISVEISPTLAQLPIGSMQEPDHGRHPIGLSSPPRAASASLGGWLSLQLTLLLPQRIWQGGIRCRAEEVQGRALSLL